MDCGGRSVKGSTESCDLFSESSNLFVHTIKRRIMFLEKLKKEYKEQDNRGTAYPFYVAIQELVFVGVIADGYSVCCPYGDGITRIEYRHEGFPETTYENKQDLITEIYETYEYPETKNIINNIEEINCGYIWTDKEFFLTIKGAEEYIEANKHNHSKLRTYIKYFERRNFEMRKLLEDFGFKINN